MDKFKKILKKLIFPPPLIAVIITVLAIPITIIALDIEMLPATIKYFSYGFSVYALTVLILNFMKIIRALSNSVKSMRLYKLLERNKYIRMFLADLSFRSKYFLHQGLVINTIFAVFKLITAIIFQSFWFGAVAAYYFTIGIIRLFLIKGMNKAKSLDNAECAVAEYKSYRLCGFLMFALNIMVTGMAVQMIRDNLHTEYPGFIIYLSAAYTFYIMTLAIINLVKAKELKSPILAASKVLNFTAALMSIFALQTSMIAAFGGDGSQFRMIANTITGSVVCVVPICLAFFMIIKSFVKIKELGDQQDSL